MADEVADFRPPGIGDEDLEVRKFQDVDESAKVIVERHGTGDEHMLISAKSWEDLELDDKLCDGIYNEGFLRPSKIQELALPIICFRPGYTPQNLIAQAQNGSGKTAAFSLGLLSQIDFAWGVPQAMVLCHTRELARQNGAVIERLGTFAGVRIQVVVSTLGSTTRETMDRTAHVLVGTPGKMRDVTKKRILAVNDIRCLVLDEADVMLGQDMGSQVHSVRQLLREPSFLQVLFFSATFPEDVRRFAISVVPNPNVISVRNEDLAVDDTTQVFVKAESDEQKFQLLCDLYGAMSVGQSIVFFNTRRKAFAIAKRLADEGHTVSLICGSQTTGPERLDPTERDRVMDEFRSGKTKLLVSTDVLSRGIDVPQVTLVVNFEIPTVFEHASEAEQGYDDQGKGKGKGKGKGGKGKGKGGYKGKGGVSKEKMAQMETYLHRVGRTGRFGLKGFAVNLVDSREQDLLMQIRDYFNCKITEIDADFEQLEKDLEGLRSQ
mmetsp:Transcript_70792/g.162302  ORF Transcript_70792/g.162302 Transcript_70792/m.162302 type:complete len:492 (+) Transcript_70792:21-1496(+)